MPLLHHTPSRPRLSLPVETLTASFSKMVARSTVLCLASPDGAVRHAALQACLRAPHTSLQAHNHLLYKIIIEELRPEVHLNAAALLLLPEVAQYGRDRSREAWVTVSLTPALILTPAVWDCALLVSACAVCSQLEPQSSWPCQFIAALARLHPDSEVKLAARQALAAQSIHKGTGDESEEAMHADSVSLLAEASAHCAERVRQLGRAAAREPEWDTEVCRLMEDESLQPLLEIEGGDEEEQLKEQPQLKDMPSRAREERMLRKDGFFIQRRESETLMCGVLPYPKPQATPQSRPPPQHARAVHQSRQPPPPARRRPERARDLSFDRLSNDTPPVEGVVTPVARDFSKMSTGSESIDSVRSRAMPRRPTSAVR